MNKYCYYYDQDYFYISKEDATPYLCQISLKQGKYDYLLAPNATLEPIPEFDNKGNKVDLNIQQIKWDIEQKKWSVIDIILQGNFYNVSNGSTISEIAKKDIEQYTTIKPNIEQNEGDIISFDKETQTWIYSTKGTVTLEKERLEMLQKAKLEKIKSFLEFVTSSEVEKGSISLSNIPNISVIDTLKNIQEVLKNKISNGDVFDYHIKSMQKTISNIPRQQAISFAHEVENHLTALGAYKRFYLGFTDENNNKIKGEIDNIKTIEQLNAIHFKQNMQIAGRLFELKKLNLVFQMQQGILIIDTYENEI